MLTKPRKTKELLSLEILQKRMTLPIDARATYDRLLSGNQGEVNFARQLDNQLKIPHQQLYGLLLKVNGSECQIDSLLIFQHTLYLLEIKNFQGDYYFDNNHWYTVSSNREIKNPLHQLNRSDLLLREFLAKSHTHFQLRSLLVFMHPEFQLYQAPLKTPVIFPSQVNRFIRKLHTTPHQFDSQHTKLIDDFTAAHQSKSAYEQLPDYDYSQLRKGVTCSECNGMMKELVNTRRLICNYCKIIETPDTAIVRSIYEFATLFPKKNITVAKMQEWCNNIVPISVFRRILKTHFTLVKNGKYSHYLINSELSNTYKE